jgi:signal transduction histidine kinase
MLARLGGAFDQQETLVRQLKALLEQQKRFTADASHELKTPLAVAKVHTGVLLQSEPIQGEQRESVEDIDRALDRMSRLVQDLLILARHDAGQLGRNATDLFVRDILEQARCHLAHPGVRPVRIDVADPCLSVFGNEAEIVRVFSNLFENAIHHTPAGGEIRAAAQPDGDNVVICVSDTGVGIAPEHIPHLGERFYRVDAARSRPDGGAGLGLSICKSIIEEHRGAISFESTVGAGTTVTVTLPRACGAPEDA